jgi:ADP-heptose:LPS heptosyltransferase
LRQLGALLERCDVVVTADTGPMHIAAAVGAPVVALFGPTDVALTGPVRNPNGAPIHVLNAREISQDARPSMELLTVDQTLAAVQEVLDEVEEFRAPCLRLLPSHEVQVQSA